MLLQLEKMALCSLPQNFTENKFNSSDINMTTFSLNFTGSDKDYISNCLFGSLQTKE